MDKIGVIFEFTHHMVEESASINIGNEKATLDFQETFTTSSSRKESINCFSLDETFSVSITLKR